MAFLIPPLKAQFFDLNGDPLIGGKVYSYEATTATPKVTYSDPGESVANTNPTILDARGEASIFLGGGGYKFMVQDSNNVEIYSVDNITTPATGPSGASFRVGTTVPADALGSNGDSYLRISTGVIYAKAAGVYSSVATISLTASTITNTASGNLVAVDIQAAVNELQTDIDTRATATGLSDHISDSTDAHAASAITNTASGNLIAVTVQGALNELQTDIDTRQVSGNYITALTGDITASGPGSAAATIANDAVTNAKLNNMAAWSLKVRNNSASGDPQDVALADIATEATPADGDFLLGFLATGELRKMDIATLPSGGGGGGALFWIESTAAPFSDIENNTKAFFYQAALAQDLFCDFRVPSTYIAGVQIRLRLPFYSPDTSGTALLSTQSTLIRTGTDAITSTVNQRTSTNAAVTLTVANRLTSIDLDLTSALGEINVVAVAPGDLIRIRLFRGTDTATSDIRALVYGAEVLTS